jgi:hypothetical protein
MTKSPKYTHPELATYLRKLFAGGAHYGWGGLRHIIEKESVITVVQMKDNGELVFKDNLMFLPSPVKKKPIRAPRIPKHKNPKPHRGG